MHPGLPVCAAASRVLLAPFRPLIAILILCAAAYSQAQIDGRWIGACQNERTYRHLVIYIECDARQSCNGFYVEPLRPENMMSPVKQIRSDAGKLTFEMQDGEARDTFSGTISAKGLVGLMTTTEGDLTCSFFRAIKLPPDVLRKATGTYRGPGNRIVVINPELRWLYMLDTKTFQTRRLSPLSESQFVFGPALGVHYPVQGSLSFDKAYSMLTIDESGHQFRARRVRFYTDEDVTFTNGTTKLAGTLRLPLGKGPFPAVVMLQGSNPQSRWGQEGFEGFVADHLARNGIAVLLFDKRGIGESDGPASDDYRVRAEDAVAAIEMLRRSPKIDSALIGLWGLSQGGQIEPYVALKTRIAFAVNTSGSTVNSNDQEIQRTELQLRADGFDEGQIREAVAFQKLKFHYACHRDNWSEYSAAVEKFKHAKWFPDPYVGPPDDKEDKAFNFWKCGAEPSLAWANYRGPVLLIYGEYEGYSSVPADLAAFKKAMDTAKNHEYEIQIIKGADHGMGLARNAGERERVQAKQLSGDYFALVTKWVLRQCRK